MKKIIFVLSIGVLCCTGVVAHAAPEPSALPKTSDSTELESSVVETAIVELDGEPLFQVRGMAGFSAEKRSQAIESRIKSAAEVPSISSAAVTVVEMADRTNLFAGNILLASFLDADAETEKISRALMAERARLNVINAMEDYRHDRSAKVLLRRTVVAAAATLAFFFAFVGIGRLYRRLLLIAENNLKSRMDSLEKRSSNVIESRPLWTAILGIFGAVRFTVQVMLTYFYLNFILGLYPWTRPLAVQLFSIFIRPLQSLGRSFVAAIPNLLFLVILSVIIKYVLKITRLFFAAINLGTIEFKDFDRDWAWPTYRITRIAILCLALVVAYPYIPGSGSDAFKGISLFVGVLFSLGSTSFISNLIAGIALTYRRAFKVGDFIRVNDVLGLVTETRLQTTHLRTVHNEVVVIPNSIPLNNHVINYSMLAKKDGVVLHTTVGIGYQTPWRQVEAMLLLAAERTQGLKKERKPYVRQLHLDTFYVQYELGVYCDAPVTMPWVTTDLHKNVLDVFNEFGIQIMTPAYEGDPESPKIVSKDQVHAAPGDKLNV